VLNTFDFRQRHHVAPQLRRAQLNWAFLYLCLLGVSAILSLLAYRQGASPSFLAWIVYLSGVVAIFYQPRYGIYLIGFLVVIGDYLLLPWYPFTKNFSSWESMLFVADAVIVSPLETYIFFTGLAWLGRMIVMRNFRWYSGSLQWPGLVFIGFIIFGLMHGLARNGDFNAALWETRAIFYLVAMLILGSNLLEERRHVSIFLWCITAGLSIRSLFGLWFVIFELGGKIGSVDRIAEHSMSILFNSIYILAIAAWIYRDTPKRRLGMLLILLPVLISYFANNRRAGFVTLGIALLLLAIVIYKVHRRAFYYIVPVSTVILVAYLGIFWNASGPIAAPAKAVRSVIGQPDPRDYSSNLYREMENINVMFTIKTSPLLGIGFGQKFLRISDMVDLDFPFADYLTHNSILWIWMKAGLGGFMSMLVMIGMSVALGARLIWRSRGGIIGVAALVATMSIVMHFIFTYVDMAWSTVPMVFVGTMMAILNRLEAIADQPEPVAEKRWPWLPDAPTPPGLSPIPAPQASSFRWW
jgi:hypothetical protein